MMRKLLFTALCALTFITASAGGLMTNTNYHIAFDRMFARGATTEIDAAYSNPAGLAWGHEGFQLSINFQKPWQKRNIELSIPKYLGTDFNKKYEGVASAPIVPALFASYKKENWAFSAMIGIVGSAIQPPAVSRSEGPWNLRRLGGWERPKASRCQGR